MKTTLIPALVLLALYTTVCADIVVTVSKSQTNSGSNSPIITCKTIGANPPVAPTSYTMSDGTSTWNEDSAISGGATVTKGVYTVEDNIFIGTLILDAEIFTSDKTITCAVKYAEQGDHEGNEVADLVGKLYY